MEIGDKERDGGACFLTDLVRSEMLASKPYHFTGDLTKVVWVRGLTTKHQLTKAIFDSAITMIEVNVIMGHKKDDPADKLSPVIANSPETNSEMNIEDFLRVTGTMVDEVSFIKGFKLYFKSKDAFIASLPTLRMIFSTRKKQIPIWLAADVLPGPGARIEPPMDAHTFLSEAVKFPQVVISVAWAVLLPCDESGYSSTDIDAMLALLNEHKLSQPVTVSVPALLAQTSHDGIMHLMRSSKNDTSLKVWCSPTDRPDVRSIKHLLNEIGNKKMYLDIPADMISEMGSPIHD